jgi:mannose-6-phosphate isomerase-like protein (cupin superfamily)
MGQESQAIRHVRRIVTGENAEGRSIIVSDGPTPHITVNAGGLVAQVPWITGASASPGGEPAPAGFDIGFHSEGGTILRIVDFPPDGAYDVEEMKAFLDKNGVRDKSNPRHFWFHKTPSLDYAIVLEGEIYAMLDDNETLLRAGDVLVQRATNHSWSNRSGAPCRMAFVLIALSKGETA